MIRSDMDVEPTIASGRNYDKCAGGRIFPLIKSKIPFQIVRLPTHTYQNSFPVLIAVVTQ